MIKNRTKLERFYRDLDRREKLSYKKAAAIYDALHKEAVRLGAISHKNIWDGFDAVLQITRAVKGLSRDRKANKKNSEKAGRR